MSTLPNLVLYFDPAPANVRIQKNISSQNEIWIEYDFLFPQQYITDGYDWSAISRFQSSTTFNAFNFVEGWRPALSAPFWHEDGNGGILWSHTSPGDVWNHFKMHYLKGVGNGTDGMVEAWHNGTYMEDPSTLPSDHYDYVGLPIVAVSFYQDTGAALYVKNIKIGTTDGGTQILNETFASRDFSQWDVNSNGLLVPDPKGAVPMSLTPSSSEFGYDQGTERLALTPSAAFVNLYVDARIETFALKPSATDIGPSSDTAVDTFHLTPSTDEHYCPEKVSVEGDLDSRWEATSEVKWPGEFQSRWEGQFLGIGEGFAC